MCLHGAACTKPLCFFAHSPAELRAPQKLVGEEPAGAAAGEAGDPAEALVALHAALGGGRFSLAAAMAEVQLRQRRLYGAAPPPQAAATPLLPGLHPGAYGALGATGAAAALLAAQHSLLAGAGAGAGAPPHAAALQLFAHSQQLELQRAAAAQQLAEADLAARGQLLYPYGGPWPGAGGGQHGLAAGGGGLWDAAGALAGGGGAMGGSPMGGGAMGGGLGGFDAVGASAPMLGFRALGAPAGARGDSLMWRLGSDQGAAPLTPGALLAIRPVLRAAARRPRGRGPGWRRARGERQRQRAQHGQHRVAVHVCAQQRAQQRAQ